MPDEVVPEEFVRRALNEFLDHLIWLVLTKPDTRPPTQAPDAPRRSQRVPCNAVTTPNPKLLKKRRGWNSEHFGSLASTYLNPSPCDFALEPPRNWRPVSPALLTNPARPLARVSRPTCPQTVHPQRQAAEMRGSGNQAVVAGA